MTVLSDEEILESLKQGLIKIAPFKRACLNPSGYDLRSNHELVIGSKEHELACSLESIEVGLTLTAFLHIRSSLAREGMVGSFAVVDPGFKGQLTLALHNAGAREILIRKDEPIVQIVFHKLGKSVEKGYEGSYQHSQGIVRSKRSTVQVGARASLCGMESVSR